jgi:hypothetical protein
MPVLFHEGKAPDGSTKTSEGYKNVLTSEEYRPPNGHNDPPPCPTGELITLNSASDLYRQNYDQIRWDK